MEIIFYNILSITIGTILIYFGIATILKKKKLLFGILTLIHAVLFIGFGIFGFLLPEEYKNYSFIVILAMLAFSLTEIICFLLLYKKEEKKK
jgi:hypothetical protein